MEELARLARLRAENTRLLKAEKEWHLERGMDGWVQSPVTLALADSS